MALRFVFSNRVPMSIDRHPVKRASGAIAVGLVIAAVLAIGPGRCEAARLTRILTAQDLSQPIMLDQDGNPLPFTPGRPAGSAATSGSAPMYMAYSLHGGEHLPSGLAVIAATTGSGAVGPLDFTQSVKTEIDAALASSRVAEVAAPSGNFLIAYLPRYAMASSVASAPAPTTSTTPAAGSTSPLTNGLLPGPLGSWLNTGSAKVLSWTNQGLSDLETLLNLKRDKALAHSRAKANTPSLNLEAQVLAPFTPAPAPIPEPGTWVSFGIILCALATTGRGWNRNRADSRE